MLLSSVPKPCPLLHTLSTGKGPHRMTPHGSAWAAGDGQTRQERRDLPRGAVVVSPSPGGLGELLGVRMSPPPVVGQGGFRRWQGSVVTTRSALGGESQRRKVQMQVRR